MVMQGYTYHIKDSYFEIADDQMLLQNKEDGNYRPTIYCIKDEENELLWMVPLSSQVEKYTKIKEKIISKGKPCRGIVIGEYDGKGAAFLIQNMFPITELYIDHIHTRNGRPVPVKKELQKVIKKNVKRFLALNKRGIKVTFTDIDRLKGIMLNQGE